MKQWHSIVAEFDSLHAVVTAVLRLRGVPHSVAAVRDDLVAVLFEEADGLPPADE